MPREQSGLLREQTALLVEQIAGYQRHLSTQPPIGSRKLIVVD